MSGTLLVRGGRVIDVDGEREADILIVGGKVAVVAADLAAPDGVEVLDASGKLVFPGLIDPQVHFREPGWEHKEDLESGARAAVAGGVTSVMEMPNTNPTTTTPEALADKLSRAAGRMAADHAFFFGASPENAEQLADWENLPGCCGVKMFMGSSTGSLLVAEDKDVERVLRSGKRRVAVHSEDEARLRALKANAADDVTVFDHPSLRDVEAALKATTRLLNLVEKTGRPVHVLHLSTAEEVALIRERDLGELVTCEVTPNHLFMAAPDCYERHGTWAQMNPPVRDARHRDVLREALADGTIACIGSDHAPHTAEEKAGGYPNTPSGIPGVQTILPLLLTAVRDGWLSLADVARVTTSGPAAVWDVAGKGDLRVGFDGDLAIVDPSITEPLPAAWLQSRSPCSPYIGMELAGWPTTTVLRGEVIWRDHAPVGASRGKPLRFTKS